MTPDREAYASWICYLFSNSCVSYFPIQISLNEAFSMNKATTWPQEPRKSSHNSVPICCWFMQQPFSSDTSKEDDAQRLKYTRSLLDNVLERRGGGRGSRHNQMRARSPWGLDRCAASHLLASSPRAVVLLADWCSCFYALTPQRSPLLHCCMQMLLVPLLLLSS